MAAGGKVTVTNRGQAPHTMTLDDGVTAFVLATTVVAAFLGGIGISAFGLRRRAAT